MPRTLWVLVIGMVINVTGASFLWPLNTIYIHDQLGKSLTVAGIVLMLNSGASVIGNLVGGTLFDKVGGYKSVLIGIIISMAAIAGLVFFNEWPYYVILLIVLGFGSGIVFPAMYAMAGSVWPEGGRRAFNAMYVGSNVGVAVGAALGGLVASYSFQYVFTANAVMYLVFLLLAVFGYRSINVDKAEQQNVLGQKKVIKNYTKLRALLIVSIGYILCWLAYSQWASTIASYTQGLGISMKQYSILWTINGALIVIGQPVVNTVVRFFAKTLKSQIVIGIFIFIGSFIVLLNTTQFTGFIVAMLILTVGEMFVWPAVPTIANELAPKGREGFYQGIVNSMATGGRMLGPVVGGVLVDLFGMSMLFFVLIGLLTISVFTTLVYDRKLKQSAVNEENVVVAGAGS
ncbi:MDR family MFS transporter [Litchfieldia salsa]|uniref:Predicted arabinose efflux permease, MFS family n=1 Tax=Litchfieldia salsa TaxID=930152 RepID=A0A1H0QCW9_9BACI|nr:MFS transporter [Litchfieldia salsa]SDP15164.1 Predicted arabinose efflux permease, MFS family [Litchfieldia salsa]